MNFIIKTEVYPFDVFVYFGTSEGFIKEFKKLHPSQSDMMNDFHFALGKTIMFPDGTSAIWMREKPKDAATRAILSHEIFHCVCFIMNKVGIKLCDKSDEAFAYLIEYLTRKIYENIK